MPVNTQPHPIFANEHNPGQISTQHRSIERARLDIMKNGKDPEFGKFQRDWGAELIMGKTTTTSPGQPVILADKAFPQQPGVWPERHYKSPSGKTVVVRTEPTEDITKTPAPSINPHDLKAEVNGTQYSKAAAEVILTNRYGISI